MKAKRTALIWVALFSAACLSCARQVAKAPVVAAKPHAVLVELFTSEGCSSCPPADKLLEQMSGRLTARGDTVIALSEHVTYWNHDGWADPFSQDLFTDRQNAYGEGFHLDSVYTPQMVIGGDRQMTGSDTRAIARALQAESTAPVAEMRIVSVARQGKTLQVTFTVSGDLPAHGADVVAVIADDHVSSSVGKGENAGRTLTHVDVARSWKKVATLKTSATQTVSLDMPEKSAADGAGSQHLVMLVQERGQGRVLGVASAPIA